MTRYLLDTDVSIEIMRRRDAALLKRVHDERDLAISMITEFELLRGAMKAGTSAAMNTVQHFLVAVDSLSFDREAAAEGALIRVELETAGRPIGPYDVLIAGHTRATGLVLVTRNTKHFRRVHGLRIEKW